jgi:RNA polymerase sigma-70 factor (ECF subfamily)
MVEKKNRRQEHMDESDKECELILRAKDGSEEAFTNLVELYQVSVYNLCYRMLGDPMQAEEAAQETFMKAFKGLRRYDINRRFSTWLLSIASHQCIDWLRRRRLPTFSLEQLLPSQQKPDRAIGPEETMVLNERQDEIRGILERLGYRDRALIVLHYWYELPYEVIAQSLSLSVSAVKSRLYRARRQLAQYLMEREPVAITARGKRDEASAF